VKSSYNFLTKTS